MEKQYRDASNLNARIALHERFSTSKHPWTRWVFDQIELPPESRILELGCGTGKLWRDNLDRVPEGWSITLTDLSPGMLREAERNLGADRFDFRVAGARELPFEDASFDAVIANFVLFFVPDRPGAFSGIARVLEGGGGTLYAATSGRGHVQEMGWMLRVLDPTHTGDPTKHLRGFNLGNGAGQLSEWFSEVSLRRHEDALAVTTAKPLVDYLLSRVDVQDIADRLPEEEFEERVSRLAGALQRELVSKGSIPLTKDTGLFVARR